MSHLALPLIGEGEADVDGDRVPGRRGAGARRDSRRSRSRAKDGLALISANAATVGRAALVLHGPARARSTLDTDVVALSFEGFRANLIPLDPRAQAARPAPGQADARRRES